MNDHDDDGQRGSDSSHTKTVKDIVTGIAHRYGNRHAVRLNGIAGSDVPLRGPMQKGLNNPINKARSYMRKAEKTITHPSLRCGLERPNGKRPSPPTAMTENI